MQMRKLISYIKILYRIITKRITEHIVISSSCFSILFLYNIFLSKFSRTYLTKIFSTIVFSYMHKKLQLLICISQHYASHLSCSRHIIRLFSVIKYIHYICVQTLFEFSIEKCYRF